MRNEDSKWVSRCRNGDLSAFEKLVKKYHKLLFNLAYRMTNNYDDSEDITQTVFIKAYENLGSYNQEYKFYSWIYRIALNESINHWKSQKRKVALEIEVPSDDNSPADNYDALIIRETVQNALMQIKPKYRTLIILKHFQNNSYADIALILAIPEQKVKSRLFTARKLLKNILENRGLI